MPAKIKKAGGRRPKAKTAVPARRVQEMLLELAYRLHTTRPVATLPRPSESVA